ncbi:MAG: hypothetical protein KJO60_15000, partial [Desulfofustis sp.]|nr:hypothetical protein [Desulfofustis sp.]
MNTFAVALLSPQISHQTLIQTDAILPIRVKLVVRFTLTGDPSHIHALAYFLSQLLTLTRHDAVVPFLHDPVSVWLNQLFLFCPSIALYLLMTSKPK